VLDEYTLKQNDGLNAGKRGWYYGRGTFGIGNRPAGYTFSWQFAYWRKNNDDYQTVKGVEEWYISENTFGERIPIGQLIGPDTVVYLPAYESEIFYYYFNIVNIVGDPYTISFNINGGSGTTPTYLTSRYDNVIYFPNSNDFSRSGYTFNGWHLYAGNTYIQKFNAGDGYSWKHQYRTILKVAYAVWSANIYNITYDANGGTLTGTDTMPQTQATYGTFVSLRGNRFLKTGYYFHGWGLTRLTVTYDYTNYGEFTYNYPNDITLYAIWLGNPYNITYNANGGTLTGSGTMSQTVATYGSDVTLRANIFSRTGYNFNGWGRTADVAASLSYTDGQTFSYNIANTIILYARWIIITKTVTFNNNQIGTISRNVIQNYGTNVNFPTFKAVGYTFVRWVDVNNLPYTFINPLTDDKILFAVWEKKDNINFSELSRVYNGTRSTESKGSKSISIGNFRPESGRGPNETIKLIENFKTKG
jgi:hypothetical protein